jgi:hypothetical protein
MDEHIFAAAPRLNKSVALLRIELLHCADGHSLVPAVDILP